VTYLEHHALKPMSDAQLVQVHQYLLDALVLTAVLIVCIGAHSEMLRAIIGVHSEMLRAIIGGHSEMLRAIIGGHSEMLRAIIGGHSEKLRAIIGGHSDAKVRQAEPSSRASLNILRLLLLLTRQECQA